MLTNNNKRGNYNQLSDEKLLLLYRQGNQRAFNYLYERYEEQLLQLCLVFGKNHNAAEELYAFAMIDITKIINSKKEITSYKAYIFKTTRSSCLKHLEKNTKIVELMDIYIDKKSSQDFMQNGDQEPLYIRREQAFSQLYVDIRKLDKLQAQCLTMFYIENFSYKQIAQQLKLSENMVRSKIQNAKRMLKNMQNN